MKNGKAYLTLQNGKRFVGNRFGADGDIIGELVFTTGMTGYIETLTDPSYYGQIVTQTFPLILLGKNATSLQISEARDDLILTLKKII